MYVKNSIKKLERIFEKLENFYQNVKLNTICKNFFKKNGEISDIEFFCVPYSFANDKNLFDSLKIVFEDGYIIIHSTSISKKIALNSFFEVGLKKLFYRDNNNFKIDSKVQLNNCFCSNRASIIKNLYQEQNSNVHLCEICKNVIYGKETICLKCKKEFYISDFKAKEIDENTNLNILKKMISSKVYLEKLVLLKKLYEALLSQDVLTNSYEDENAFYLFMCIHNYEYIKERALKICQENDVDFNDSFENLTFEIENKSIIEKDKEYVLAYKNITQNIAQSFYISMLTIKSIIKDHFGLNAKSAYLDDLLYFEENKTYKTIEDIDIMSGFEFENYVSSLFENMGFNVSNTKLTQDQGVDIIAKKGNYNYAIQTKCYKGTIGNFAIQEVVAGLKYYNADKAIVITNSTFTKSAIELARSNNVELWDREVLKEKIRIYGK